MRYRLQSLHTTLLIAALFGYSFVASVTNALHADNTPVSIALRSFIIVVSVVLLSRHALRYFPKNVRTILLLVGLFWVLYLARLIADTVLAPEILGRAWTHYWIWGVGACLIPFAGISSRLLMPHDVKPFKIVVTITVTTLILAALFGSVEGGRYRLEALNPISLGNLGAIAVTLVLWKLIIAPHRPKGISQVAFYVSVALLGFYLTLLTGSRGPLVGMMVSVLFIMFYAGWGAKVFATILVGILVIFGFVLLTNYSSILNINTVNRLARVGSETDRSSVGRLFMIESAWKEFTASPILGSGLELRSIGFYPHNVIMESFMATGVLGGSVFTLIVLVVTIYASRLLRLRLSSSWISVVFLHYAALGQFSGALYQSTHFWGSLGGVIVTYGSYLEWARLRTETVCQPRAAGTAEIDRVA